jgi:tight adherence protein C
MSTDIGVLNLLFDRDFLVMSFTAILAFATIVTLGVPLLERKSLGNRMKSVAERREELRIKHHATFKKRATLRSEPVGFMKQTLESLNISKMLESPNTREKLIQAGFRGQGPLITFLFFRFVMPFILFAVALLYIFVITHLSWSGTIKFAVAVAVALLGYYVPDLFISNKIQRRRESIMRAFPDALDLLLICVESGMSIEAAFSRVASEVGSQSIELAEEFGLTTAELSYLPERRLAFENLAKRCGHSGVKAIAAALNQSEKYGTPLGQALRVCALESREARMVEAEKKAAALPAKLTVPMIVFFLPCLFVVILGPAIMKVMHIWHH